MVDDNIRKMIDYDIEIFKLFYKIMIGSDLNSEDIRVLEKNNISESEFIDSFMNVFIGVHSKYSSLINDFPDDINFEEYVDCDEEIINYKIIQYLKKVVEKLNTFKMMGYSEINKTDSPNIYIHNENNNRNENNLLNTQITFQEAKQKIENMSVLTENEIEEILQKINQLEGVVNSSDRKSKKWENAKGIIKWVADKSFDVAKVIIPLVLKME